MATPESPRYQPDNSPEARQRRIEAHRYVLALVVEVPIEKHRVTPDTFCDNVVHVDFGKEEPEDLIA